MIRIHALLLITLAACGHASSTPATATGDGLSIAVDLYAVRGGTRTLIHEGEAMASGEVLEVEITPSSTAFLYVVQQRPSGALDLLAPDHGDVAFSAGETVRLPPADADYELYLDDDVGVETLIVMASPRPIAELDADAGDVVDEARDDPAPVDAGVEAPAPVDAGVPPSPAIDAGTPAPEKVVRVKRKKTRQRKAAGGTAAAEPNSIALHPRGIRKRPKRVEVSADAEGVVIYPYVFVHQ